MENSTMGALISVLSALACFGLPVLAIFLYFYLDYAKRKKRQAELDEAARQYREALDSYATTQDMVYKVAALEAGRNYARVCRQNNAVAIFDEMKLNNDIMVRTR